MEEQMAIQNAIEESKKATVNPDVMSYEEMLALGEKLGNVTKGFTQMEIDLIPLTKIRDSDENARK